MNDVLELPFDQYQRYRLVADLCECLRTKDEPLSILDVGGRTALLRSFAPKDRITLVDVESSDEPGLILGSGAALPFADGSFDVVCAFDTLEHVPPEGRAAFVAECERVSRGWILLAGPYDAPRVAEAEELLQSFLADKLHTRHRYLEEHRSYGLPDRAATEAQFEELGCRVVTFGHGNLDRWFVLMCLALYLDEDPALRGLAKRIQRFYNESLYASDHAEPVYRHVVVAAKEGQKLPDIEGLLDPPVAPEGTLSGFAELTTSLIAFDQERDAWRAEKDKWATIEADLGSDLRGNREKTEELGSELEKAQSELERLRADLLREQEDGRQAVATLERDLAEHHESLRGVTAELDSHRAMVTKLEAELERERSEGARDREAIAADLAAHQASLREAIEARDAQEGRAAELMGELERTQKESATVIRDLEADLVGHREALQAARGEASGQAERADGLARELDALRSHVDELTATLHREREAQAEVRATLEQDLAGHAAVVRDQAGALEAAATRASELEAEVARLSEELGAERETTATLRAELRNRWRNVRRAFSLRPPTVE